MRCGACNRVFGVMLCVPSLVLLTSKLSSKKENLAVAALSLLLVMQTRRRHRVEARWQRSSIANLADDSVLHICALLSDPLCPRKSYKSIPAMSAACHGFHTLISPLLHSLRQTMRVLHSLDGFVEHDLLIHVLRKPCLRFHGYRGENCAITPPCGSVFAQDSGEPIVSCPRDKAERMLAALLPLPALSHLRALVLGVAIVHDLAHQWQLCPSTCGARPGDARSSHAGDGRATDRAAVRQPRC